MPNLSGQTKLISKRTVTSKKLRLPEALNRRLTIYAFAAAASGVSVNAMAATNNAQSNIVYTPANFHLSGLGGTNLALDLNHDGVEDITLMKFNSVYVQTSQEFFFEGGALLDEPPAGNAAILAPLPKGASIGASADFHSANAKLAWGRDVGHSGHSGYSTGGPWAKSAAGSFLGVRFLINGETHYGWIRMTISIYAFQVSAVITGYAYNTVANQPIRAGQGMMKSQIADVQPGSLGALSLGADGLKLWRKQE